MPSKLADDLLYKPLTGFSTSVTVIGAMNIVSIFYLKIQILLRVVITHLS
jgi:hypothetical protein